MNGSGSPSSSVRSPQQSPRPESPHSSPSVGQHKPDHLGPAEDAHDAPLHGKIDAASRTASHTTGTLPEIAAPAATTTLNSTRPDLAKTQTPANLTDEQVRVNLSSATSTGPTSTNNQALPPATGPQ
ncbi:hypothetical protein PtA15_12A569 [Puccinia triticina]|uniref:Uncharacterized protein n=1 Tax=Puccinia triticina TaxID=208348 RepID=A0ABY7D142_9BASI|nr:uncharacterized protein PtA15_12A569 [Puccinia triticina]WAQ90579.1 hypothetical protein PtA15_12A569 [Puccinia triticina]